MLSSCGTVVDGPIHGNGTGHSPPEDGNQSLTTDAGPELLLRSPQPVCQPRLPEAAATARPSPGMGPNWNRSDDALIDDSSVA